MTQEAISSQIGSKVLFDTMVNIHFKQRNTVTGLFIKTSDFDELRSKNLWRIVTKLNVDQWKKTKDINLCRIFNGTEFTRLSEVN